MAISENVIKVFEYVKAHNGEQPTAADVANGTGLPKKQVQGCFMTLRNKGVGHTNNTKPGSKIDTIKFIEATDEGKAYDGELSEMGAAILDYLKKNDGEKITGNDIAEALNAESRKVIGAITALCKEVEKTGRPALARRVEAKIEVPAEIKYFTVENADIDLTAAE